MTPVMNQGDYLHEDPWFFVCLCYFETFVAWQPIYAESAIKHQPTTRHQLLLKSLLERRKKIAANVVQNHGKGVKSRYSRW